MRGPATVLCVLAGLAVGAAQKSRSHPLAVASAAGDCTKLLLLLLQGDRAQIDAPSAFGMTALHLAAARDHTDAVSLLLEHGASAGVLDDRGWTPLHVAASRGSESAAQRLLSGGSDPSAIDPTGQTARALALVAGHDTLAASLRTLPVDAPMKDAKGPSVAKDTKVEQRSTPPQLAPPAPAPPQLHVRKAPTLPAKKAVLPFVPESHMHTVHLHEGADGEVGVTTRPTDALKRPAHPWERMHAMVDSWFVNPPARPPAAEGQGPPSRARRPSPAASRSNDVAQKMHKHHMEVAPEQVPALWTVGGRRMHSAASADGSAESAHAHDGGVGATDGQEGTVGVAVGGAAKDASSRTERMARQAARTERRSARMAEKLARASKRDAQVNSLDKEEL